MTDIEGTEQNVVKILVVEDSPTQLEELQYLLQESGYSVVAATNGMEGLAAAKTNGVDLVISDIVMPEMDGYTLCKALRSDPALRHVPVILLTSLGDPRDVIAGLEAGANNFICKPYDDRALLARVQNVIANEELRKTSTSEMGINIFFAGQQFFITADRLQILDLLLSTYENAVNHNQELIRFRDELRILNEQLEARIVERTTKLTERVKELKCLYAISSLVAEQCGSIDDSLKAAVDLIPSGLQYPEIACARIVLDGQEFVSANSRDTAWKLSADIVISQETVGKVEVCYLEEESTCDVGPFLKEERDLIIDIARQLGVMIQRERAIGAVRKSEEHHRHLFENMNSGVAIYCAKDDGADFTFVSINRAGERISQITREQVVGKSILELFPSVKKMGLFQALQEVWRTGISQSCGETFYQDARLSLWIQNSLYRLPSGEVVVVYDDVTEIKRIEAEADRTANMLNAIFEGARDGIMAADEKTRKFVAANKEICRMLGYQHDELLALAIGDIHPTKELPCVVDQFERQLKGEISLATDIPMKRKDGSVFFVDVNSTQTDLSGRPCLVGVFRDITERVQAEEEKNRLQTQLFQSQKMESIGNLASGVAHEINNPINIVTNYAELILDQVEKDGQVAKYVESIMNATDRVTVIVKNLLAFSRQDDTHFSPARVGDIVGATVSLIQKVLEKDQIMVEVIVPDDLPSVQCRSQQIQQVLMNLLTNARDALNSRYPGHDEDKIVRILARSFEKNGAQWIRMTVENQGESVPEEVMKRIFEPFYTTKPRDIGTGLGLSVSHGIVTQHKGKLTAESEEGGWTRFHVDLPVNNGATLGN